MAEPEEKAVKIGDLLAKTIARGIAGGVKFDVGPAIDAYKSYDYKKLVDQEKELSSVAGDVITRLGIMEYLPDSLRDAISVIIHPKEQFLGTIIGEVILGLIGALIGAGAFAFIEELKQAVLASHPILPLPADVIARLAIGGVISHQEADEELGKYGYIVPHRHLYIRSQMPAYPYEMWQYLIETGPYTETALIRYHTYLGYPPEYSIWSRGYYTDRHDISTLISAYWRGLISWDIYHIEASKLGYTPDGAELASNASRPVLDWRDALHATWRGYLHPLLARKHIISAGWPDTMIPTLMALARPIPTIDDVIRLYYRLDRPVEWYRTVTSRMGYAEPDAVAILRSTEELLSPEALRHLYLRQIIPEMEHDRLMMRLGYSREQVGLLRQLYYYIPSPPDLVSMAVRDTWNEEVCKKYGYDEDYPAEFELWAQRQGMSPEWSRRYWRAHWQLPSPTMGYEMLHRGIIDETDLATLLKISDYPKYWRDKLIKLSYVPYTRVDVRRMYTAGVLTRDEVKRAYKDLGYDEDHAEKLTQWTTADKTAAERDLTKSEILSAYADGILKRDEASDMLEDMGYDEHEIEIILSIQDYKLSRERRKTEIESYGEMYKEGMIQAHELYTQLIARGYTKTEIDTKKMHWDTEILKKRKRPSLNDLLEFYRYGIISRKEDLIVEIMRQGYSRQYAEMYAALGDVQRLTPRRTSGRR